MADQVMPPIDKDMAKIVEVRLAEHGVHLHLGNGLKDIENDGTRVVLADGTAIETDLVILSMITLRFSVRTTASRRGVPSAGSADEPPRRRRRGRGEIGRAHV